MRRLHALVSGLPRDAALLRKLDPEQAQWGTTAELLAALIEVVDMGNRMYHAAHTRKGTTPLTPVEIRRPGGTRHDTTTERRRPTREDFRMALLGG